MIKLLYFMRLAEIVGCSREELVLPQDVVTVGGLLVLLMRRGEHYQQALGDDSKLQITINKKFVELATSIIDGDEIAFFPAPR